MGNPPAGQGSASDFHDTAGLATKHHQRRGFQGAAAPCLAECFLVGPQLQQVIVFPVDPVQRHGGTEANFW